MPRRTFGAAARAREFARAGTARAVVCRKRRRFMERRLGEAADLGKTAMEGDENLRQRTDVHAPCLMGHRRSRAYSATGASCLSSHLRKLIRTLSGWITAFAAS